MLVLDFTGPYTSPDLATVFPANAQAGQIHAPEDILVLLD